MSDGKYATHDLEYKARLAAERRAEKLQDALREYQNAFYSATEGNRSGAVNDLLYEYFDAVSKETADLLEAA